MAVAWANRSSRTVSQSASSAPERARHTVVTLVFWIYAVFLLEGMLRKWILPQFSEILYFIRDPLVLFTYWIAFSRGLVQVRGFFLAWLVLAVVTSAFGLIALALNGIGIVAGLLAARSYWLYLPLAFVVASCFRNDDLLRFVRLNLLVALPIAILVVVQYQSPPGAFVNRGIDADAPVATVVAGVVRPYAVFTYTGQHVVYVASLAAVLALGWIMRRELRLGVLGLMLATGAVAVMALTTGSRSIYFFGTQLAIMLGLLAVSAGRERDRSSALLFLLLFAFIAAILFTTVLHPAFEAIMQRNSGAEAAEGAALLRALGILTSFTDEVFEAPILGYGIGAGTSTVTAWTGGIAGYVPAENEWARIVQELGPVLGLTVIMMRSAFVLFLGLRALKAARRGNAAALVLLGFVAVVILAGQITFSTIIGFLAWLYVGLALAMTREEAIPPAAEAGPRFRIPPAGAERKVSQ